MSKSNVIDLKPLLENKKQKQSHQAINHEVTPVINMEEKRKELLLKEHRQTKRTILSEFVGAFIIFATNGPNLGGLQKVNLYDISDDGLSFDMEPSVGRLRVGEEIAMRIYLSQKNYFSFTVRVTNLRFEKEEGTNRHGCQFLKGSVNKEALYHFVKFIENVSLNLKEDFGDKLTQNSK